MSRKYFSMSELVRDVLIELRKKAGYSQADVASGTGIARETVSRIEQFVGLNNGHLKISVFIRREIKDLCTQGKFEEAR